MEQPVFKGQDTAELFETAPVVAEGSFHSQHEPHLPIEPDVLQAYWGVDGMMTIQCKCQSLTENREFVSMACGIPKENIRMHPEPRWRFFRLHGQLQHLCAGRHGRPESGYALHADSELRRVQPHDRQEVGHLHQRPHRLRRGRQDHRRRIRHRPRPRRLRTSSVGPSSTTSSRSDSTATTSPTSRPLPAAVPRTMRSTPPTAASALLRSTPPPRPSSTWPPRRPASIPGSSATRTRPGRATSPSTAVPITNMSIRLCSRRPSRSTTSTRLRPRRPRLRAGMWASA